MILLLAGAAVGSVEDRCSSDVVAPSDTLAGGPDSEIGVPVVVEITERHARRAAGSGIDRRRWRWRSGRHTSEALIAVVAKHGAVGDSLPVGCSQYVWVLDGHAIVAGQHWSKEDPPRGAERVVDLVVVQMDPAARGARSTREPDELTGLDRSAHFDSVGEGREVDVAAEVITVVDCDVVPRAAVAAAVTAFRGTPVLGPANDTRPRRVHRVVEWHVDVDGPSVVMPGARAARSGRRSAPHLELANERRPVRVGCLRAGIARSRRHQRSPRRPRGPGPSAAIPGWLARCSRMSLAGCSAERPSAFFSTVIS